jgi:hypothetical protein
VRTGRRSRRHTRAVLVSRVGRSLRQRREPDHCCRRRRARSRSARTRYAATARATAQATAIPTTTPTVASNVSGSWLATLAPLLRLLGHAALRPHARRQPAHPARRDRRARARRRRPLSPLAPRSSPATFWLRLNVAGPQRRLQAGSPQRSGAISRFRRILAVPRTDYRRRSHVRFPRSARFRMVAASCAGGPGSPPGSGTTLRLERSSRASCFLRSMGVA